MPGAVQSNALAPVDGPSGWEQRRARVARALEDIAVALFAARGYARVSYDDVADAAGVSTRTVYRYFPAKEEFLLAEVRRSATVVDAALRDLPRSRYPINDVIELMISLSELHHDALARIILWSQAVSSDAGVASRVHGEQAILMERAVLDFCCDSRDRGRIDPRSPRPVAASIVAIMHSVFEQWVESDGRDDLSELYRAALSGIHDALRP